MTAEHSAGTAVFSSLRQLATSALRSTVRAPLTADNAAALLASGERRESAGSDFGSEGMFMRYFTQRLAAVQPAPKHLSKCAPAVDGQEKDRRNGSRWLQTEARRCRSDHGAV